MKIRITGRRAALAAALVVPVAALGVVVLPSAYAAVAAPIRVNANGPAFTDSSGRAWSADRAYSSGSWGYDTLYGAASTGNGIAGTTDDTLYQSYNLFSNWTGYKFDVANGTYTVTLKFMEDWANAAGQRKFDVRLENTVVLTAFDIFATVFPEANGWTITEQAKFIEQAKGRFEAILAVTGQGAEVDEALTRMTALLG